MEFKGILDAKEKEFKAKSEGELNFQKAMEIIQQSMQRWLKYLTLEEEGLPRDMSLDDALAIIEINLKEKAKLIE